IVVITTFFLYLFASLRLHQQQRFTIFPYTTLFRSLIVIGNGTASRETEQFIADVIKRHSRAGELKYIIVNEAGASVYSASPLARSEEHTSELQSRENLVCRLLLEKKKLKENTSEQ